MLFSKFLRSGGARSGHSMLVASVCVALSGCLNITGSDGPLDASSTPDADAPVGDANVPVGDGDAATQDAATVGTDAATEDAATEDAAVDEPDAGMAMITGAAEKGPFVLGSSVTISVVDNDGDPTGEVFNTQTTDDLGHFEIEVQHPGPVELAVTGYYYNEATGALSVAPLTLRGWYRVLPSGVQTANLNVITHLTNRRVRALFADGMSLDAAIAQAEAELVAALDIGVPESLGGTSLDISSSGYLLAVSAVLAEAGRAEGGNGGADAALQELLNGIANDLSEDGAIAPALHDEIVEVQATVDIEEVTERLAERYEELGSPITVPDLNEQLDSDLDGVINSDDNCPNVANADQADGNSDGVGDACCGDGTIEGDEACDDGASNADDAACTAICAAAYCGDTLTWAGNETCDDGNTVSGDGCDANCRVTGCGNGVTTGSEECDDSNVVSGDGCDANCQVTGCGNGITTGSEACDDGNLVSGDGCDANCQVPGCGNGIPVGSEECDDGNAVNGDGCDANCTVTACGNGITTGSEECDDGNDTSSDACGADCTLTADVQRMTPTWVDAGSDDFPFDLTGTGFAPDAYIMFGDTELFTTIYDGYMAVATIPAPLLAEPGVVQVTLVDGDWVSEAFPFTIRDPDVWNWYPTGSLSSGCRGCTGDLLANGQVLIVGGTGMNGLRATASLYNPATGLFTDTDSLDIARDGHRSVRLNDGRLLVAGGITDLAGTVTNSVEVYNPGSGRWTSLSPMTVARANHAMVLLGNGRVLVCGGSVSGSPSSKSAEIYDPSTNTWSDAGDMGWARANHTATLTYNGKVMVVGGGTGWAELYTVDSWEIGPNGSNVSGHSAVLLPTGAVLAAGDLYIEGSETWPIAFNSQSPLPEHGPGSGSGYEAKAVLLESGKVLIAGGWGGSGSAPVAGAVLYDPETDTLSLAGNMRQARSDFPLVALPSGKVLAAGGFTGSVLQPTAEIWHPVPRCSIAGPGDPCCGDGTRQGDEACDSGALNADGGACTLDCTVARCGDGLTRTGYEVCDDGNLVVGDGCEPNCTLSRCGDGIKGVGEACDDGNQYNGDGCDNNCTVTACGNGILTGREVCDDGNQVPGDGCEPECGVGAVLRSLNPRAAVAGRADLTVTFQGNYFYQGAQVMFGDDALVPATLEFSSASVIIPAALMAQSGSVLVTIDNPNEAPGNPLLFTVLEPEPTVSNWSLTGALETGRMDSRAHLLANGQVLLVAGYESGGGLSRLATLYDPTTGVFTDTASLLIARSNHASAVMQDGRVFVAGGYGTAGVSGGSTTKSAEIYRASTGRWVSAANMNNAREGFAMASLPNGTMLVCGGRNGQTYDATAEIYNPTANTWTLVNAMSTQRSGHTASLLPSGEVLVVGGSAPAVLVGASGFTATSASSELYDPATGQWTSTGSLHHARSGHSAVLLPDGKVLVTGGTSTGDVGCGPLFSCTIASSELYDPATGLWTAVGDMIMPRASHGAVVLESGEVLVAGGSPHGGGALASAEIFDPVSATWSFVSSMQQARRNLSLIVLPSGEVLAAGGFGTAYLSTAELWDPTNP